MMNGTGLSLKEISDDTLAFRLEDPWVRGIPMELLLAHQLETMATSPKIPAFKLLVVGRNLLEYIREAKSFPIIDSKQTSVDNVMKQLPCLNLAGIHDMKRIFSKLFRRILATKFDVEEEASVKRCFDTVWAYHVQGKIDFSESDVIHLLLEKFPKYVEEELVEAIKKSKPEMLVPLCVKHSHTFHILFTFLSQIFEFCNHHPTILNFTKEFLDLLELIVLEKPTDLSSKKQQYGSDENRKQYEFLVAMYPLPFHPVLHFIAQVNQSNLVDTRISFQNPIILDELINLINELIAVHPEEQCLINFFLVSNSTVAYVINSTNQTNAIILCRYPSLWELCRRLNKEIF